MIELNRVELSKGEVKHQPFLTDLKAGGSFLILLFFYIYFGTSELSGFFFFSGF